MPGGEEWVAPPFVFNIVALVPTVVTYRFGERIVANREVAFPVLSEL